MGRRAVNNYRFPFSLNLLEIIRRRRIIQSWVQVPHSQRWSLRLAAWLIPVVATRCQPRKPRSGGGNRPRRLWLFPSHSVGDEEVTIVGRFAGFKFAARPVSMDRFGEWCPGEERMWAVRFIVL